MTDINCIVKKIFNEYIKKKCKSIEYIERNNGIKTIIFDNKNVFDVYDLEYANEEKINFILEKFEKNKSRLSELGNLILRSVEVKICEIGNKKFLFQFFKSIDNDAVMGALINKIGNNNISYLQEGGESKVFLIKNANEVIKVYCGKDNIKKDQEIFLKELEKQMSDLQGINGLAKPKEIGNIKIEPISLLTQSYKYMENNTLFEIIINNEDYSSFFPLALKTTLDLLYLHRAGIVHYDIKPENIFINYKGNPKIGDFGFIERMGIKKQIAKGSFGFIAPEIMEKNCSETSTKADIYSLGVIFFYMFISDENTKVYEDFMIKNIYFDYKSYNQYLLDTLNEAIWNKKLVNKIRLLGDSSSKLSLLLLIRNMISINPENRPDIEIVRENMTQILLMVRDNYKKFKINGKEYDFKLKNREQLILFPKNYPNGLGIDFEIEEIKKMEKNICKRIISFLSADDITDEFKFKLCENLDKIFPSNNFPKFDNKISAKMYLKEKEILEILSDQLNIFKNIKANFEKSKNEEYNIESEFCNTLDISLKEFNVFEDDLKQQQI